MLLPIPDDVLKAEARDRMLSIVLGSVGLSAAAVSASFAIYMVATAPGGPPSGSDRRLASGDAGLEYRPLRASEAAPSVGDEGQPTADPPVDFTPTGSIGTARPDGAATPAKAVLLDYAVRDVFDDTALVEARGTLQMVRQGSVLAGVGEVLSIKREGPRWVVATTGGTIEQRR